MLDCCKLGENKLPEYNGLVDRNLSGYFTKDRLKKHMYKMKLVYDNLVNIGGQLQSEEQQHTQKGIAL